MAHYNQGIGYLYMGESKAAVDCLKKAIELDPKNAAAYYHLGPALEALGRIEEAKVCVAYSAELGHVPNTTAPQALPIVAAQRRAPQGKP
jgi:Flp pilus assembly protein TadD